MSGNQTQAANKTTQQQVSFSLSVTHDEIATFDANANRTGFSCDTKVSGELNFPKVAQGFHGYYTVGATKWHVDSDGDIRDGELLIAEPSYLSRQGYKNAALIAAAPELLAACKKAYEYLTRQQNQTGELVGDLITAQAEIALLSHVIGKAEGNQARSKDSLPF